MIVYSFTLTLKAPDKNCSRQHFNFLLLSLEENKAWFFHVNPLSSRGFTWNIKSYFLWKTMKKYLWMSSAAVLIGPVRVWYWKKAPSSLSLQFETLLHWLTITRKEALWQISADLDLPAHQFSLNQIFPVCITHLYFLHLIFVFVSQCHHGSLMICNIELSHDVSALPRHFCILLSGVVKWSYLVEWRDRVEL